MSPQCRGHISQTCRQMLGLWDSHQLAHLCGESRHSPVCSSHLWLPASPIAPWHVCMVKTNQPGAVHPRSVGLHLTGRHHNPKTRTMASSYSVLGVTTAPPPPGLSTWQWLGLTPGFSPRFTRPEAAHQNQGEAKQGREGKLVLETRSKNSKLRAQPGHVLNLSGEAIHREIRRVGEN